MLPRIWPSTTSLGQTQYGTHWSRALQCWYVEKGLIQESNLRLRSRPADSKSHHQRVPPLLPTKWSPWLDWGWCRLRLMQMQQLVSGLLIWTPIKEFVLLFISLYATRLLCYYISLHNKCVKWKKNKKTKQKQKQKQKTKKKHNHQVPPLLSTKWSPWLDWCRCSSSWMASQQVPRDLNISFGYLISHARRRRRRRRSVPSTTYHKISPQFMEWWVVSRKKKKKKKRATKFAVSWEFVFSFLDLYSEIEFGLFII